ncbi:MAG: hypothetical protein DRP15_03685 [Candidatus Aenigmatarchaeota archaeon]|nr:MAG: hypothetical protein DRP15_03685 [Candidatus Aenigmarchaeota archaeon]
MTRYFLLKTQEKTTVVPIKLLNNPKSLGILSNPLGWRIFQEFSNPACPIDVAKKLRIHEQKIYYYLNKFKKTGFLKEVKKEQRKGTVARFYQIKNPAFGFVVDNLQEEEIEIPSPVFAEYMKPFISKGRLKARIIVGSPDPHGPWNARASDSSCAIDLALFLGAFTSGRDIPNYRLDTEVRENDLKGNLILVGGPVANMITQKINDSLPVYIDVNGDRRIVSKISGRSYQDDEYGMIAITENPWNPDSKILVLAGKRFQGTRAAVISLIKNPEKTLQGNKFDKNIIARVIRGQDLDGDGTIDNAEIVE